MPPSVFLSLEGEDTGEGENVRPADRDCFIGALSLTLALSRWERGSAPVVPVLIVCLMLRAIRGRLPFECSRNEVNISERFGQVLLPQLRTSVCVITDDAGTSANPLLFAAVNAEPSIERTEESLVLDINFASRAEMVRFLTSSLVMP